MISIIMPVKNEEKFLGECLDSILAQTERDWELLAVDDNSEDSTGNILEEYARKDPRIIPLKNQGKGIIYALQTGYARSRGNFITRMDADDKMAPRKLELLKNALEFSGKDLATGFVKYFSATGMSDGYLKYESWLNRLTAKSDNFKEIYKECVIPSPCWMTRRETFEQCGGFATDRYPEDYDLCFRFYENSLQVIGIKEVIHHWRDYATRSSRTDSNYADNRFLDLKIDWFLKIDKKSKCPLVVWGTGKKGKLTARKLIERGVDFTWISNNEKKIGKDIYGVKPADIEVLKTMEKPQILILVANAEEQNEISVFLKKNSLTDYFFFC